MLTRAEQIFAGVEAAKELVLVLKLNIQQSIRPSLENFRFVLSSSLLVGNLSGKLPAILVRASDVNNYLVNTQRWGDASQRWNVKIMSDYLWYSLPLVMALLISWNLVFFFHVGAVFFLNNTIPQNCVFSHQKNLQNKIEIIYLPILNIKS